MWVANNVVVSQLLIKNHNNKPIKKPVKCSYVYVKNIVNIIIIIEWCYSYTSFAIAGIDAILRQKHKRRLKNKKLFLHNCPQSNYQQWMWLVNKFNFNRAQPGTTATMLPSSGTVMDHVIPCHFLQKENRSVNFFKSKWLKQFLSQPFPMPSSLILF